MVQYIVLIYCTMHPKTENQSAKKILFAYIMIFSGIVKEIDIDITP